MGSTAPAWCVGPGSAVDFGTREQPSRCVCVCVHAKCLPVSGRVFIFIYLHALDIVNVMSGDIYDTKYKAAHRWRVLSGCFPRNFTHLFKSHLGCLIYCCMDVPPVFCTKYRAWIARGYLAGVGRGGCCGWFSSQLQYGRKPAPSLSRGLSILNILLPSAPADGKLPGRPSAPSLVPLHKCFHLTVTLSPPRQRFSSPKLFVPQDMIDTEPSLSTDIFRR